MRLRTAKLTNLTILLLMGILMAWSLSCSTGDRNNGSAEIESKVEATLTAVAEMATPTAENPLGPAAGFQRLVIGDNRSIDIPETWTSLKLDEETVSGISAMGFESFPELDLFFSGDEVSLRNYIQQGIMFMAFDSENTTFEFSPNVNILTENLAFRMSTDNYLNLNVGVIPSAGGEIIERSLKNFGGSDVGMFTTIYETEIGKFTTIQYLWTEGDVGWIVTMSFLVDHNYSAITEAIARSMF